MRTLQISMTLGMMALPFYVVAILTHNFGFTVIGWCFTIPQIGLLVWYKVKE